ncbi:hypothetical protein FOC4_g10007153 [Fusarium odoratissimum]|uniref:Uncharacterized protein n=1 Tax=Fusarium oxysporum f. sp. cubense (strain race 4) TaxID=2502994 RepID=N1RJA0_FUSC4|nr:hypothetical protein FOC4_g10007153 [Fusarium odoratissimum]
MEYVLQIHVHVQLWILDRLIQPRGSHCPDMGSGRVMLPTILDISQVMSTHLGTLFETA